MSKGRYWNLLEASAENVSNQQERFEDLLRSALRTRLVSDAPMGIFLSGGLDSSVVAAMCQRESETIRSSFSVGFDDPSYDERGKARRVAERIGTRHHEIVCAAADVPSLAARLSRSADHLLADQSMVPLAKLAVEAKQTVKVVLTGDGGDELLAGYATYRALAIARHYLRFVPGPARSQLARLAQLLPASSAKMAPSTLLSRFLEATTGGIGQAHSSWRSIWSHDEIDALLTTQAGDLREWRSSAAYMDIAMDRSLLQRAVFADVSTWLVDSILAKVDRATMATGLEARSPLLDSRLFEFAFGTMLAPGQRNAGKKPLRRLATSLLGAELAAAKKEGFQTPFAGWFAGPLRSYLKERIDFLGCQLPGAFRAEVLWKIEADHAACRRNHDFKLWNLVALSEWAALYPGLVLGDPDSNNPDPIYGHFADLEHL
jgi:asparagine synthase (glutamine-hydrolysing)